MTKQILIKANPEITIEMVMDRYHISSKDTVALYSQDAQGWVEEWRGDLLDYLSANDIDTLRDVLDIVSNLSRGAYRTGGGAEPIFELRLVA